MARPGTKPMIDERSFVPRTLDDARALYEALVGAGTPVSQARGIVTWLLVLPDELAEDDASHVLRSRYRRRLLELGSPPWETSEATVGELRSPELAESLIGLPPSRLAEFLGHLGRARRRGPRSELVAA